MKTFNFYRSMEQEHGDELPLTLNLDETKGLRLERVDEDREVNSWRYDVFQGSELLFSFKILPPIPDAPGRIKMPPAAIIRLEGDQEGQL